MAHFEHARLSVCKTARFVQNLSLDSNFYEKDHERVQRLGVRTAVKVGPGWLERVEYRG